MIVRLVVVRMPIVVRVCRGVGVRFTVVQMLIVSVQVHIFSMVIRVCRVVQSRRVLIVVVAIRVIVCAGLEVAGDTGQDHTQQQGRGELAAVVVVEL